MDDSEDSAASDQDVGDETDRVLTTQAHRSEQKKTFIESIHSQDGQSFHFKSGQ